MVELQHGMDPESVAKGAVAMLHGIEDFQIVREDTLRIPAFTD